MDTKNQNEPEPTDVQARVLLDVTEDIPTFYVNYIEVSTSTPHDLYLICARIPGKLTRDQLLDAKESKEVFFQPEVQIVMTPDMNTFDSAPTYSFARFEGIAATPGTIKASPGHRHSRAAVPDDIKSAVYSHIQAIRSLGRTKTNTAEIADALDLDMKLVEAAVHSLREAGVRRAR